MKDLIQEYFSRDLTEGESKQLGSQLAASPEEAERFSQLMDKHYKGLGLPNPVWRGAPLVPHGLGYLLKLMRLEPGLWSKRIGLALLIPVLAGVYYKMQDRTAMPLPSSTLSAPSLDTTTNPVLPQPQYQQLSVDVELPNPGLVTVKVFDDNSTETKTLYAGVLPAGKKVFIWDGKKEDGTTASPGTYFIQVKSGKNQMRREVHIQAE